MADADGRKSASHHHRRETETEGDRKKTNGVGFPSALYDDDLFHHDMFQSSLLLPIVAVLHTMPFVRVRIFNARVVLDEAARKRRRRGGGGIMVANLTP
jgi:hypothetical protein